MSQSPPEHGPEDQQEQPFGAPPGSAQWPQGGFANPSGRPAPTGPAQQVGPGFNPQPYGGPYPPQPGLPPPPLPPPGGYPQPGGYPLQGGYPPQGSYPPQSGYPQPWPQGAYAGYAPTAASFPASTAVLLAVSVVAAIATGIIGIPSAVIAALAWRQNGTDPAAAARRTTKGWIVLGINFALGILLLIPFFIWASNNP